HSCGLDQTGAAWCWGSNISSRLGVDTLTTDSSTAPVAVDGGLTFTEIAAGGGHRCGVASGGLVCGWWLHGEGQLRDGASYNRFDPVAPTLPPGVTAFISVTTGSAHTCAVANTGDAYCWGSNISGQVGDGTTFEALVPTLVAKP